LKYLSVCSGIEAATVAWHSLGWQAVGFSEIEKFPSQVLAHHYPDVPNLGDMTKYKEWNLESNVDVFVGGTPCQSFSVAGLRKGLDDPRGNLMLTYLAIADKYRPRWLVWENVPGVLSSNGGKDFGTFLGGLGELGYGFAYRVLDAQYFGVAQRRRRVFVVGYLGDWRRAAAVLFERHSLSGNPAPRRQKRESVAASTRTGIESSLDCGVELTGPLSARDYKDAGTDGMNKNSAKMIPVTKAWPAEITSSLCASDGPKGVSDQYAHEGKLIAMAHGQGGAEIGIERCPTLTCVHEAPIAAYFPTQPIALAENTIGRQPENGGNGDGFTDGGPMYTLNATGVHGVAQPISFDMAQITSKVNGTRVEPGLPVSTLAKGSQMHVAQPVFFEPRSPDGVPRIYPMDGASPTLKTMGGGQREPCVTHPAICLMDQGGSVMNVEHDMTGTLRRETHGHEPIIAVGTDLYNGAITGDVAATMSTHGSDSGGSGPIVMQQMAVRRLTPKECERLQGFPDNYSDIMPKGKPTPDGPRYKALGNSMAVPVMAWIGKRIQEVDNI
jgi:DNA (cytosine-5)-methyltransferase 1